MQVNIQVAIIVALGLIVDGSIYYAELFVNTRNKVWCLVDALVDQCLPQMLSSLRLVAQSMIARSQCTVCTCYLVDIAIGGK